MSELAVVSSRRSRLQVLVRNGRQGARAAVRLNESPTRFLSAIQIGITLVGVFAGAFSGVTLSEPVAAWLSQWPPVAAYAEPISIGSIVAVVTYVSLVIGELVPKSVALRQPERIATLVAPTMESFVRFARPFTWLLEVSTDALLRPLGLTGKRESTVTEDEVRALIAEGTRAGVFVPKEREMIDGVLRLADRRVGAIMTPRQDIVWLDSSVDHENLVAEIINTSHTRLLVCDGSLDELLGIAHTRDLMRVALLGETINLRALALEPIVVPERLQALSLLDLFRRGRLHIAVVVDEYGSTEGIVTLSDVLRSIAGSFPETGDQQAPSLYRRDDGSWVVDGGLPVDDFEHAVGVHGLREDADFETIGGFVLHRLGRIPVVGDRFDAARGRFEVIDMDGRRIDTVLYTPSV
jgi:putative hemolysin